MLLTSFTLEAGQKTWDKTIFNDILDELAAQPGAPGDATRALLANPPQLGEDSDAYGARLNNEAVAGLRDASTQAQQGAKVARIKAKDFIARGFAPITTPQGSLDVVRDEANVPLEHFDKRHNIGYDSTGMPRKVGFDFNEGAPVLSDPYADAPQVTDKKTGDIYKAPAGLPWQWSGQDEGIASAVQAKQTAAINRETATALAQPEAELRAATKAAGKTLKASGQNLNGQLMAAGVPTFDATGKPIDFTSADPEAINEQIDSAYAATLRSPEANKKKWFGDGLTPEAQNLRQTAEQSRTNALDALTEHAQNLGAAQQTRGALEQVKAQRSELTSDRLAAINEKRVAAGLAPVGLPNTGAQSNGAQEEPAPDTTALQPESLTPEEHAAAAAQPALPAPDKSGKPQAEGFWGTLGRAFASKIFPALGTAVGGLGAGALAIESGPGAIVADIAGGTAGGLATAAAQRKVMGAQWAEANQAQMQTNAQTHPVADQIGTMVPFLLSLLGGGGGLVKAAGGKVIGRAVTADGKAAVMEAAQKGEPYVAPLFERVATHAAMGARAATSEGAQEKYVEGKDVSVLDAGAKGAVEFGALGLFPAAKTMLSMAGFGKSVGDAAAMTLAGEIYDAGVHGKPLTLEDTAQQFGGNASAFVIQNALLGLFHRATMRRPGSGDEGGISSGEDGQPPAPPPEKPSTLGEWLNRIDIRLAQMRNDQSGADHTLETNKLEDLRETIKNAPPEEAKPTAEQPAAEQPATPTFNVGDTLTASSRPGGASYSVMRAENGEVDIGNNGRVFKTLKAEDVASGITKGDWTHTPTSEAPQQPTDEHTQRIATLQSERAQHEQTIASPPQTQMDAGLQDAARKRIGEIDTQLSQLTQENPNAVSKQSSTELLPREQSETGKAGSERGRVGQSESRTQAPAEGQAEAAPAVPVLGEKPDYTSVASAEQNRQGKWTALAGHGNKVSHGHSTEAAAIESAKKYIREHPEQNEFYASQITAVPETGEAKATPAQHEVHKPSVKAESVPSQEQPKEPKRDVRGRDMLKEHPEKPNKPPNHPYDALIAEAKAAGKSEVALRWGDWGLRQVEGTKDFAIVNEVTGEQLPNFYDVHTASFLASKKAAEQPKGGEVKPPEPIPGGVSYEQQLSDALKTPLNVTPEQVKDAHHRVSDEVSKQGLAALTRNKIIRFLSTKEPRQGSGMMTDPKTGKITVHLGELAESLAALEGEKAKADYVADGLDHELRHHVTIKALSHEEIAETGKNLSQAERNALESLYGAKFTDDWRAGAEAIALFGQARDAHNVEAFHLFTEKARHDAGFATLIRKWLDYARNLAKEFTGKLSDRLKQSIDRVQSVLDEIKSTEQKPPEAVQPRQGKVGDMLASGEVVLTSSGRKTTPFPDVKLDTSRKATNTVKKVDQWLIDNAIAEAKSRGDRFNGRMFEAEKANNLPPASKDAMEEYLFGNQPKVIPSPLKTVVSSESEPAKPEPDHVTQAKKLFEGLFSPSPVYVADLKQQAQWLESNAKKRGHDSVAEFALSEPDVFAKLTAGWRNSHPITESQARERKPQAIFNAMRGGRSIEDVSRDYAMPADKVEAIYAAVLRSRGALAAPSPSGETYEDIIPPERAPQLVETARSLVANTDTASPDGLAKFLSEQFGGKANRYTQSLWHMMKALGAKGASEPDWKAIYQQLSPAPQEAAAQDNPQPENQPISQSLPQEVADRLSRGETVDRATLSKLANGLSAKQADELAETGVIMAARAEVQKGSTSKEIFDRLVNLYNRQPNLTAKTSESKINQQYSTPVPIAYLASQLADITGGKVILEPTAGNGALLIEAHPDTAEHPSNVIANEIDPNRREDLKQLGFGADSQDATKLTLPKSIAADREIMNPPFGSVMDEGGEAKRFPLAGTNETTTQIDHAIALQALQYLTPDGRAALILGGKQGEGNTRADKYMGGQQGAFWNALYDNFGVVDHFTINGDLYSKQGAGWPIDVVLIQGRKSTGIRLPSSQPPRMLSSWKELSNELDRTDTERKQALARDSQRDADALRNILGSIQSTGESASGHQPEIRTGSEPSKSAQSATRPDVGGVAGSGNKSVSVGAGGRGEVRESESGRGAQPGQSGSGTELERTGDESDLQPSDAGRDVEENSEPLQVSYTPQSKAPSLDTLVPVNLKQPTEQSVTRLKEKVGDLDQFVSDKLGYPKDTDIGKFFAAEQIEDLTSAIYQIENGGAEIIGHQPGVGKGRVAAGMLVYAHERGVVPVFVTKEPKLYAAMMDDLNDIGRGNLVPFFTNTTEVDFTDANGREQKANKGAKAVLASTQNGLPTGYDLIFTTYPQLNQPSKGFSELPAHKMSRIMKKEMRPFDERAEYMERIAPEALFVLDESHLAAGDSETGWRFQHFLQNAAGTYYSSGTFAKTGKHLALYYKTALGNVPGMTLNELGDVLDAGGAPLLQVMTQQLAESGQYRRLERSFEGVPFETKINEANADRDVALADQYTKGIRSIMDASEKMDSAINRINTVMRNMSKKLGATGSPKLETTGFGEKVHNFVGQYILATKAKSVADEAIAAAQKGERVVVALQNTNEGPITALLGKGADLNYNSLLMRSVEDLRTLRSGSFGHRQEIHIGREAPEQFQRYTEKELYDLLLVVEHGVDADGKQITTTRIDENVASELIRRALNDILLSTEKTVGDLQLGDLPLSPIDYMRQRVEAAGVKTGEITGRVVGINAEGKTYSRSSKEVSKAGQLKVMDGFNNGNIQVVFANQSGSTGISLHASEKFKRQEPRVMILAQPHLDINEFMQMLLRIHRSGQVVLPRYVLLQSSLAAEFRTASILAKKMKRLNANTTSNAKTAVNAGFDMPDVLNQYGDQVTYRYLSEDKAFLDMLTQAKKVKDKLTGGTGDLFSEERLEENFTEPGQLTAYVTGKMAILPDEEQNEFWRQMKSRYDSLIRFLNETGQNELDVAAMDIKAHTLASQEFTQGIAEPKTSFDESSFIETVKAQLGRAPESAQNALKMGVETKAQNTDALTNFKRAGAQAMSDAVARAKEKSLTQWTDEKSHALTKKLRGRYEEIYSALVKLGEPVRVDDGKGLEGYAVVTGVKHDPKAVLTPSEWIFSLTTNTAKHTLKIPASQFSNIVKSTDASEFEKNYEETAERENTRHIITGNLLAAYNKLSGDVSGNKSALNATAPGQPVIKTKIITYTTDTGEQKTGILLPQNFSASLDKAEALGERVENPDMVITALRENGTVQSKDKRVRIVKSADDSFELRVPASRSKGGEFWRHPQLNAKMEGGLFTEKGTWMVGRIADLPGVLKFFNDNEVALYAKKGEAPLAAPTPADTKRLRQLALIESRRALSDREQEEKRAIEEHSATANQYDDNKNTRISPAIGQRGLLGVRGADQQSRGAGQTKTWRNPVTGEYFPLGGMSAGGDEVSGNEASSTPETQAGGSNPPPNKPPARSTASASDEPLGAANPFRDFYDKDVAPVTRGVWGGFKEAMQGIKHLLSPTSDVDSAALDVLMRELGNRNKAEYIVNRTLAAARKGFDKMGRTEQIAFIDRVKTGEAQPTPELQTIADTIRAIDTASWKAAQDAYRELGYADDEIPLKWLENHYRVLWKVIPGSDEARKMPPGAGNRPLQGSKGMLKQHTLADMSEGLAMGGEPFSYNPVVMFQTAQADIWKLTTALRIWKFALDNGFAKFEKGKFPKLDAGRVWLNDNISRVYFKVPQGTVEPGRYSVEKQFGRVLNNFLSADLIRQSQLGKGLLWVKNFTTQAELFLSLFHGVFEGLEAVGSQIGLGLGKLWNRGLLKGSGEAVFDGLKDIITSFGAPVTGQKLGSTVRRLAALDDPTSDPHWGAFIRQFPEAKRMLKALFSGGWKPTELDQDWKNNSIRAFVDSLADIKAGTGSNYIGAALRALPAANEMLMKPLFDHFIPNLKLAAFFKEFQEGLKTNHTLSDEALARQSWRFVEDRFGELNYDTLFWNRTFKTAMQLMFRSVTWKLGSIEAFSNAFGGQAREFKNAFNERRAPELHRNMAWLLGMFALTAAIGYTISKALGHHDPENLTDVVFPRYDEKEPKLRVSIPTYWKDLVHLLHSPANYVKASSAGWIGRVADLLQNQDYYGMQIRNTDDDATKQALQVSKFAAESLLPFSVRGYQNLSANQVSGARKAMAAFGVNPAPRYIGQTKAEVLVADYWKGQKPVGGISPEAFERQTDKRKLVEQIRHNAPVNITRAIQSGTIKPRDVKELYSRAATSPLKYGVSRMPLEEAERVFAKANAAERQELMPVMASKRANTAKRNSPPALPAFKF